MPNTTEQILPQSPDLINEEVITPVQRALSGAALRNIELSAGHFYSGEQFIGRTRDGEHRLIVGSETVGSGQDMKSALQDALEGMRSLETVRTRSLASIEMNHDGARVDIAEFKYYAPKMAPDKEVYPVPEYLGGLLEDDFGSSGDTYKNTIEEADWQTRLRALLVEYISNNPDGKTLVEKLGIRSLSHLTPEQAVKFSAAFVQNVSKYEYSDNGKPAGERADNMTSYELLREGMDRKNDPTWRGNGVCRNVACNAKSVFEALKDTQAEMSMLRNTYCILAGGSEGSGYDGRRPDNMTLRSSGHAWNKFVTVDKKGSATVTIIDATWALGQPIDSAIEHLDFTESRAIPVIVETFQKSENKEEAFDSLGYYVDSATRHFLGGSVARTEERNKYMVTEYLKAAQYMLRTPEGLPEDFYFPSDVVMRTVSRLASSQDDKDVLDPSEVSTLFALNKAQGDIEPDWTRRLKYIIKCNDKKGHTFGSYGARRLIFNDTDLQGLVFETLGQERLQELADSNGEFRARLRESHPEKLPPFDASARKEDMQELRHFASENNISGWSAPEMVMREFKDRLKKLVGDDAVYEAITVGRTDYDLMKNFRQITLALRDRK